MTMKPEGSRVAGCKNNKIKQTSPPPFFSRAAIAIVFTGKYGKRDVRPRWDSNASLDQTERPEP
jgi:hypothetical protein